MSETHLQSGQLGFQILHSHCGIMFDLPRLVGRRTEKLEFLDDDLGFVHLGLFGQSFEFLQTVMLSC